MHIQQVHIRGSPKHNSESPPSNSFTPVLSSSREDVRSTEKSDSYKCENKSVSGQTADKIEMPAHFDRVQIMNTSMCSISCGV